VKELVDQRIRHGGNGLHYPFTACSGAMPLFYLIPVVLEKMFAGGQIERSLLDKRSLAGIAGIIGFIREIFVNGKLHATPKDVQR
jgi:hypothetical protein